MLHKETVKCVYARYAYAYIVTFYCFLLTWAFSPLALASGASVVPDEESRKGPAVFWSKRNTSVKSLTSHTVCECWLCHEWIDGANTVYRWCILKDLSCNKPCACCMCTASHRDQHGGRSRCNVCECLCLTLGFSPLDVVLMASGSREPARESRADPAMGWTERTAESLYCTVWARG